MGYSMPYFPIYAAETLADGRFQSWSCEERGAWLTLLCLCWNDGDIPSSQTILGRLLHLDAVAMASAWSAIGDRFIEVPGKPGRLMSPRLEVERQKAENLSRKRALAGEEGAKGRWNKGNRKNGKRMPLPSEPHSDADGNSMANRCPPPPTPPPSPPPTPDRQTDGGLAGDGQGLGFFRSKLAARLGVPKVGVGKNAGEVLRFFQAQLASVGEECLLNDCQELAKQSRNGTPSTLSWFVGWLERLPSVAPPAALPGGMQSPAPAGAGERSTGTPRPGSPVPPLDSLEVA